jgi:2,3-bisphosphoglycerate-independent phosphoglycerate mutase
MSKMKSLLIVCDGMGDRLTGGKTPLEVARTPNMDGIAREGITGIMDTVRTGVRPGSDTAHLSLFGYDPFEVYTGRGPFEAYGANLELKSGDVALRCNFATIRNGRVIDRRAGRDEQGLEELAAEVSKIKLKGAGMIFKRCAGHRAVLVLRGRNLSSNVTDTDPEAVDVPPSRSRPLDGGSASRKTADLLNEFTRKTEKILSKHPANKKRKLPANVVLCRGAGIKPELESFGEKYGIKAVCISATTLIKGVCKCIGMDVMDVEGATGHVDSKISRKAKVTLNALKKYDLVFLHIKGTDEASHDGNFDSKRKMIERIDREVIGPVLKGARNTTIVLTADHSTPLSIRQHSADPVPVAIIGDVRRDHIEKFTERECSRGGLNRICGLDLINLILDISDRAKLFGA